MRQYLAHAFESRRHESFYLDHNDRSSSPTGGHQAFRHHATLIRSATPP
jgi:hypothetical protein